MSLEDGAGPEELVAGYRAAIERYVEAGEEQELQAAYAFGRAAFEAGTSLLEFVSVHREVAESALVDEGDGGGRARVRATFDFLVEGLATFEIAQSGYWEGQARARLEREQLEARLRLARAYETIERALDLPARLEAAAAAAVTVVPGARVSVRLVDADAAADDTRYGDTRMGGAAPDTLVVPVPVPGAGGRSAEVVLDLSERGELNPDERFLLGEFARMLGLAIENARLFERERSVGLTLQERLLPASLPSVPGLDVEVRYLPGEADQHAGGDWYDVFELDDGRVGLVVGDVTGHGVSAAAAMGHLRVAALAYALDGHGPAAVLTRVDRLARRLPDARLTTMVYVVLDPPSGQATFANAGHPSPIVVAADGRTRDLRTGRSRVLGVDVPPARRSQGRTRLPAGAHLLLYTDGLIDRAERSGRDGHAELLAAVAGFTGSASQLCDRVLAAPAGSPARDDICVLAVTVHGRSPATHRAELTPGG